MSKIQILSTKGCGPCESLKKRLDGLGVTYEVIYLDDEKPENEEYRELLAKEFIATVPVTLLDGKIVFTGVPGEDEIKEKLGIK